MQLRHFVSGSSVILTGWLAITFVHQVPTQRYPKLDKYPTTSLRKPITTPVTTAIAEESTAHTVSVSR
jgi:hypothetical protein